MNGAEAPKRGIASTRWWRWTKRLLALIFFSLVAWLLVTRAQTIEWGKVYAGMRGMPMVALLPAVALAAASHALYSCFDLLGRHVTGHSLPVREVMLVNFISYAFNLNLGSLIGGVGFRYRLYSRHGLDTGTVTRVVAISMMTNWLGYLLLAGIVFWWRPVALPSDWKLDAGGLQLLGAALTAVAAAYIPLCAFAGRRDWRVRGVALTLPSARLALLQLAMSSLNWMLMAGIIFTLLERKIVFSDVLGVLLVAAIAGVIAHVPAGLGVIEAVFIALLPGQLPRTELLAALLAYRAIYYLVPLAVATLAYLAVEVRTGQRRS